ncbi:SDR family NAD(P)-dependent oxidoreductase [Pseudomonas sp. TTU2014-080ASC]|uniref:SDR family NAD(P)-dependent oxidoreductase n=1 Tax=Pseudomonas sp. TTU2014-080ASC TaxID=1729724 RepID=UPI000718983C|nr:3-oxoacyl-ACP reductase family protein [Pseudomonas sp. TTU2014-080ASC]KRW59016.1 3-oxoacyl-ACP reductase [Pseudomonas sp. TTU2014-080ASC]
MSLQGKVALITGSSSGIGRAVALAFARAGARAVVVNYPQEAEAGTAAEVCRTLNELGCESIAICADVSCEQDVQRMVEQTLVAYSRIDILVNNAGIAHSGTVDQLSVEVWDRVLAVHLRGTFLMTRAVLPLMYEQKQGRIINTVSQLAYKGAPGLCAYTAAKGGILSFTRSVALEIGARDITINCVAPGATLTPILEAVPSETLDRVRAGIPLGRLAQVEDISPSYVFLASDSGRHFQGQCISPNGGDHFL